LRFGTDFSLVSRLRRIPLSSAGFCHGRRRVFFSFSMKSLLRFLKVVYSAPEGIEFRGHTADVVGDFQTFSFPCRSVRLRCLVGDVLDKRQYVLDQWVSLCSSYFLGCDFIAEHWGQARSCRARRYCVMIFRRFNKRQRLIKQKVTLRLPRFHRKFLGARSLGTDNSREIANWRPSFWRADQLKAASRGGVVPGEARRSNRFAPEIFRC
jgi:hypothetical protein